MSKKALWVLLAATAGIQCRADAIFNSVIISPTQLMMIPHDTRLAYDIEHGSEGTNNNGDWIRLQAKGPEGEVTQTFRIQIIGDATGILGTPAVGEAEVKAVCAPYLSSSEEKKCIVQILSPPLGNIYYCLLTNAALAHNPTSPPGQFQYLFLGVFRIGGGVAVVIGNLSHKDDVNFRMMIQTLEGLSTLPITGGAKKPA